MKPVSPVIPGENLDETVVAENQPEYENLPVVVCGGGVILSRWELSEEEKRTVQETGSVWLFMHTFGKPVTPVSLQVEKPQVEQSEPPPERDVEYLCAVRYSAARIAKAESLNIETAKDKCIFCGEDVIVSAGSLEAIKARPDIKIICLECVERAKADATTEFVVLPETAREIRDILIRNQAQQN